MQKFLMAAAVAVLGATAAQAADMPVKAYTKAPPMAAVYDWSGFYIGVSGGGAWGSTRWQYALAPGVSTDHNVNGGFAGGQIGYNWQWSTWVFGLEADGHWANAKGSTLCPNPLFECSTKVRGLASVRARLGYAAGPVLLYGTGGGAYAKTRYEALIGGVAGGGTTGLYENNRWGYAAGAGIEWGFAPKWSAKLEYIRYGFGGVTSPAGTLGGGTADLKTNLHTVKAGINYHF